MKLTLHKEEIAQLLDISPPFLMIDKAFDIEPGKSANSIKMLLENDWFFLSHLPKVIVMPGTLQIEAMLQTLILAIYTIDKNNKKIPYITNISTKLFSQVKPNTKLEIFANVNSIKRGIIVGSAIGKVDNKIVCKGIFNLVIPEKIITVKVSLKK
jgi:3-hydroxymyristoyl/3-hydroxydecanoyl-(acyl carrier protein) dehydratase